MAIKNGGRWVFSPPVGFSEVVIGFHDGGIQPTPEPLPGAFNIEVFTDPSLDKPIDTKIDVIDPSGNVAALFVLPEIPKPDPGFQTSISDVGGGTIENGFLTGTSLRLTTGDFLVVDYQTGAAGQSGSKMTLGSGNQTVVGAKFDTLIGGSGNQVLSALAGNQTVVGGTGDSSIWGGANDSILGSDRLFGGRNQQIVVTGSGTTVEAGVRGNATISTAAQDTIRLLPGSTQNIAIAAGENNLIDLTFITSRPSVTSALYAVIGANGDTITAGSGTTNIDGAAGGMLIKVGAAGVTNLSGSAGTVAGNTITGGAGAFNFNPSAVAGKGDLIDLSHSGGFATATINSFAFGATRIVAPDTIISGSGDDSVFAGAGDRVGISGTEPTISGVPVGGKHQWVHGDTAAGSAVGFGTFDSIAGSSTALVTVGGFNTTSDFVFYQNVNGFTTNQIIATSQATTVSGIDSTILTLPDGTLITLVGVTQAQLTPALFKP